MTNKKNFNATLSVNNSVNTGAVSGATSRANSTVTTSATGGKSVTLGSAIAIGLGCFVLGGLAATLIARLHYGSKADDYVRKYSELTGRFNNLENEITNE